MTQKGNTRNYEIAIDLNNIDPLIRESKETLVLEDRKIIGFSIAYNDCENRKREHQFALTFSVETMMRPTISPIPITAFTIPRVTLSFALLERIIGDKIFS